MEQPLSIHEIITAAAYVIFAVVGWAIRALWEAVRQLERDLPSNYVRKDDYKDAMDEIRDMLRRIFDKLDNKADKS